MLEMAAEGVVDVLKNKRESVNASKTSKKGVEDFDIDIIIDEISAGSTYSKGTALDKSSKPIVDTSEKEVRGGALGKNAKVHFVRQGSRPGFMRRVKKVQLPKIPKGILYVKNGTYIGYHCTYCNCALKTLFSVRRHIAGARHKRTLLSIKTMEGEVKEEKNKPQSSAASAKRTKVYGNFKSSLKGYFATVTEPIVEGEVKEKNKPQSSAASAKRTKVYGNLKSSLKGYFATVTEPIVGLNNIVEMMIPGKPRVFECTLCKFSRSSSDEIKEHITGTRHRLMYMKAVVPKQIAGMMATNMSRTERNTKILNIIKELEAKHGRGTIQVKRTENARASGASFQRSSQLLSGLNHSLRRAQNWAHARGGSSFRGERKSMISRRGKRLFSRGDRGESSPRGRIHPRPMARFERRKAIKEGLRGRMSRSTIRTTVDPYLLREPYFDDRATRQRNEPHETFPYPDNHYSARMKYMEEPHMQMDWPKPMPLEGERYDYRQHYDEERDYRYDSYQMDNRHSSPPPGHSHSSDHRIEPSIASDPLKTLQNFSITNEKEAGVVMNVITSLAESLLGYRMRGSSQEILQKLTGEDRLAGPSSDQGCIKTNDRLDQTTHNWREKRETGIGHLSTYDSSARGWSDYGLEDSSQYKCRLYERSPSTSQRQIDTIHDRSASERPVIRNQSPSLARRPTEMRDQSPPPPRRAVDALWDRSTPPQRTIDTLRHSSPSYTKRATSIQNRSPSRSHTSFVDKMFDDHYNSQSAARANYSSLLSATPRSYQSTFSSPSNYGTPASHISPSFSTNSSFSRSNERYRLSGTDGQRKQVFDWKYRSLQ